MTEKRREISKKDSTEQKTESALSVADIRSFKKVLLDKRAEILRNVNEIEDEALKKSRLDASGDLSTMPIHMADLGTDNYEQEFALGLMDSERKLIHEIDAALQRIEEGNYGICEGTGRPIPKARLKAQPWALYCVEYAKKMEQGLGKGQEQ